MEQNFLPGTLFAIDELVGHFGEISELRNLTTQSVRVSVWLFPPNSAR